MKKLYPIHKGRSGSIVTVVEEAGKQYILKENIKDARAVVDLQQKLDMLSPDIIRHDDHSILFECIPGESMTSYIGRASLQELHALIDHILGYISDCKSRESIVKDYSDLIQAQRIRVPEARNIELKTTRYTSGIVHGDFTLDNMLFYNNRFYMIDFSPVCWDSIHFEYGKLRQDLTGCWFARYEINRTPYIKSMRYISDVIRQEYPELYDDGVYKLMISRILPYVKDYDRKFILLALGIDSRS